MKENFHEKTHKRVTPNDNRVTEEDTVKYVKSHQTTGDSSETKGGNQSVSPKGDNRPEQMKD